MSLLSKLGKKSFKILLGEYSPYYIFQWTGKSSANEPVCPMGLEVRLINEEQLSSASTLMKEQAGYLGNESLGFGCFMEGQLTGVCFYWYGEQYRARGFWPLDEKEAKLVQIIVSPSMRGHGVAPMLVQMSAKAMNEMGFSSLYSRVWHSNTPSLRAFEKAGWFRIAFVLEINPFRRKKPFRFEWKMGTRQTT